MNALRQIRNSKAAAPIGFAILALLALTSLSSRAGVPRSAFYSADNSRILWFMILSDTHIGTSGTTDSSNLTWAVTTAKSVIAPSFTVVTGDLTDSTNGNLFGLPNGPYQAEWDQYKSILSGAGVTAEDYFDLPGNHDAYNDRNFAYYLANSVQGRATGQKQLSWTRSPGFGNYHFLGINTADNSGAGFSIFFPYGDNAGLDAEELSFIQTELTSHSSADLTFVFGHHPVTDTGVSGDTWLFYGQQEFIRYLDAYGGSFYGYGHTHAASDVLFQGNSYTGAMNNGGLYYLNLSSLGKTSSDNLTVVAVDCNGVSAITQAAKTWPIVLITSPVSSTLGGAANPYSYSVPNGAANPVRALVFDPGTVGQVAFRIDGAGTWFSMTKAASSPKLWEGVWNASGLASGSHTIEVQAVGTTTRLDTINVMVTASNSAPVAANDAYSVNQDSTLTVVAPGVLANDADADGDRLTTSLVNGPGHGALTLNMDGSFTYVPATGYSGTDGFSYQAFDGKVGSNAATVTITVNAAPAADTVVVTKAEYTTKTKTLSVAATSSAAPQAVLTVYDGNGMISYGRMNYSTKSKTYTFQKKITPPAPASVKVVSSKGGFATRTVSVK